MRDSTLAFFPPNVIYSKLFDGVQVLGEFSHRHIFILAGNQSLNNRKRSTVILSKLRWTYGGAEGSRTPVRKRFNKTFSGRRTDSGFPPRAGTAQTARLGRVMMHGRGNSYPPHVRHINDAFPGLWPLRFRRLPLVRQRQQYDCCQLIFKLPVLWRSGAAARLSSLHTLVETGAAPYRSMGKDCIFLPFRVRSPPPGRLFP